MRCSTICDDCKHEPNYSLGCYCECHLRYILGD
jgi:hypothetical protein